MVAKRLRQFPIITAPTTDEDATSEEELLVTTALMTLKIRPAAHGGQHGGEKGHLVA